MAGQQVSRRGLLGGAVGTAVVVAAGVAGCSAGGEGRAGPSATPPTRTGSTATPLAAVADIPDGGGLVLADPKVVLTRSGNTVRGFSSTCTHKGCTIKSVQDGRIICPCHGSQFDAATGAVAAGPAPRPLPEVPVSVVDGQVLRA